MYSILVEGTFTAVHRHGGPAGGGVHGHDFLVLARVSGPDLVDDVLMDFHQVEIELRAITGALSHRDLSAHEGLAGRPATPAAIARWIFEQLAPVVAGTPGVSLTSVEVRDTERTGALYSAGD